MKQIELTQGQAALVDDADYEYLNQYNWYAHKDHSGNFYAIRRASTVDGKQHSIYMSRQILRLEHGDKQEADHENHRTLDNRRDNIRICTRQQNSMNRGSNRNTSSKFKGVCYRKQRKKWEARIEIGGKTNSLGLYDDPETAALAYDLVAREVFGEFAYLNFLPPKNLPILMRC